MMEVELTTVAPWNVWPLWQVAQVEAPPLGIFPLAEWFIVQVGAAKPPMLVLVAEWHDSHGVDPVGMWPGVPVGLPNTVVVTVTP